MCSVILPDGELTMISEAVISTDMVSRHIKRQEKKCDSLMVNLEYTIPENRLDF